MLSDATVPDVGDPAGSAETPETPGPGRDAGPPAWARALTAVAGGLLAFLAFPPIGWWFTAPLGVALLFAALHGARPRRAAWIGYLGGAAFLFPALAWVRPIGDDAWLALVGVESAFWAAMAVPAALVMRLRLWPLWVACLWVAQEWARGLFPVGGFPWARIAFSQGDSPYTGHAALGGAPLVTFTVVLTGALIAHVLVRGVSRPVWDRRVAAVLAGAVALPVLGLLVPRPGDEGRSIRVGVVQGNVPGRGLGWAGDEPAVVLRNHADETHRLAADIRAGKQPRPDIVVWPENSTDIDPYRDRAAYQTIDAAVKDIGVPVLVGAVVSVSPETRATRSIVWDPVTGPGDYYDKQKLVPFGEFTPYKEVVLALFERANLVGRQSVPGSGDGDLKVGPVTVGAVSCYEVAFDGIVRGTVRAGGSPLVVQTNNATYELTNLPPQQLAMSQLRAVEHNRSVIAVATTGISAYVSPAGKVEWRTAELVPARTVVNVPVRTGNTLATRVGAGPELVLILMGAAATIVAAGAARAVRASRTGRVR
ncbi:apolipoprotein N-acyltransferase [Acrocarpospora phusangensis]|uniref:Apolipoprotein N-acyltransferase n=1 Tax=Acrocarpospora phusangensis TaxID=1070424 RepID=A0A919QFY6_9ACTN|nr:apolipoprotein N-acyltransferase [Acrocarpospora phusangensis]GIH26685.1 apolipoprotein N-acyltransferase [Acrocarpospora phusangensis]